MKGVINPNHAPDNNYQLLILGIPALTVTSLGALEDELNTMKLPDRTVASGGNREATEFDIDIPMHHVIEQAAMEIWYREAQDPVSPGYKKVGSVIFKRLDDSIARTFSLIGVFPKKRALPEGKMDGEGEMQNVTWTLSVDDILPV
jgi:hypothetical protein